MKKRVRLNRNRTRTIVCSLMAFLVLFYAIAGNAVGYTGIKADTTEEVTAEAETEVEGDYIPFTSAEKIEEMGRAALAAKGLPCGGPGVTHPTVTTMGTWENGYRNPIGSGESGEGRIDQEVLRAAVFDLPTTQTDTLTDEGRIQYNDHFTDHFKFGGTETFCLEPSKATPTVGTSYTATRLGDDEYDNWLRAIFYYGYGGPGYSDATAGLDHFLEDVNKPYAYSITHIIISYAYDYRNWHNGGEQGELQTDAFKGISDANAIQAYKTIANFMWDSMGRVPENFEAYLFNEGTTSQTHHIKLSEDIFLT